MIVAKSLVIYHLDAQCIHLTTNRLGELGEWWWGQKVVKSKVMSN